jgi:cell wall-associated NlpC family hydrolase
VIGVGAVAVVCLGAAPGVASAEPVAPSDAQISAAEQARATAAEQVGALTAQLAAARAGADAAHQAAQIALQDYEDRQAAYETAKAAADEAAVAAAKAAADLERGMAEVAAFARSSYMSGSTSPGAAALMSSGGPAELLERAALLDAAGVHRTDVVAELTGLQAQADAADEAARKAVGEAEGLKEEAAAALSAAQDQEVSARAQADALSAERNGLQAQLEQAQQALYGLEGAREAARRFEQQQTAAAAVVPQRAQAGSGSPASSGPAGRPSGGASAARPAAVTGPPAGSPSGSAVQTAIAAARAQIGLKYSWGGGGRNGPSYGIFPDTGVYGFDCSGLTEYAYGRAGIAIGGTSRDQWWLNRTKTVPADSLRPGDLLFWGSDGSNYLSITHVAIYVGDNRMIEAPDRGLTVRESALRFGSSYFGAVRPSA